MAAKIADWIAVPFFAEYYAVKITAIFNREHMASYVEGERLNF